MGRVMIIQWNGALRKDKKGEMLGSYFVESYLTFHLYSTGWLNIENSSHKSYLKIDFSLTDTRKNIDNKHALMAICQ